MQPLQDVLSLYLRLSPFHSKLGILCDEFIQYIPKNASSSELLAYFKHYWSNTVSIENVIKPVVQITTDKPTHSLQFFESSMPIIDLKKTTKTNTSTFIDTMKEYNPSDEQCQKAVCIFKEISVCVFAQQLLLNGASFRENDLSMFTDIILSNVFMKEDEELRSFHLPAARTASKSIHLFSKKFPSQMYNLFFDLLNKNSESPGGLSLVFTTFGSLIISKEKPPTPMDIESVINIYMRMFKKSSSKLHRKAFLSFIHHFVKSAMEADNSLAAAPFIPKLIDTCKSINKSKDIISQSYILKTYMQVATTHKKTNQAPSKHIKEHITPTLGNPIYAKFILKAYTIILQNKPKECDTSLRTQMLKSIIVNSSAFASAPDAFGEFLVVMISQSFPLFKGSFIEKSCFTRDNAIGLLYAAKDIIKMTEEIQQFFIPWITESLSLTMQNLTVSGKETPYAFQTSLSIDASSKSVKENILEYASPFRPSPLQNCVIVNPLFEPKAPDISFGACLNKPNKGVLYGVSLVPMLPTDLIKKYISNLTDALLSPNPKEAAAAQVALEVVSQLKQGFFDAVIESFTQKILIPQLYLPHNLFRIIYTIYYLIRTPKFAKATCMKEITGFALIGLCSQSQTVRSYAFAIIKLMPEQEGSLATILNQKQTDISNGTKRLLECYLNQKIETIPLESALCSNACALLFFYYSMIGRVFKEYASQSSIEAFLQIIPNITVVCMSPRPDNFLIANLAILLSNSSKVGYKKELLKTIYSNFSKLFDPSTRFYVPMHAALVAQTEFPLISLVFQSNCNKDILTFSISFAISFLMKEEFDFIPCLHTINDLLEHMSSIPANKVETSLPFAMDCIKSLCKSFLKANPKEVYGFFRVHYPKEIEEFHLNNYLNFLSNPLICDSLGLVIASVRFPMELIQEKLVNFDSFDIPCLSAILGKNFNKYLPMYLDYSITKSFNCFSAIADQFRDIFNSTPSTLIDSDHLVFRETGRLLAIALYLLDSKDYQMQAYKVLCAVSVGTSLMRMEVSKAADLYSFFDRHRHFINPDSDVMVFSAKLAQTHSYCADQFVKTIIDLVKAHRVSSFKATIASPWLSYMDKTEPLFHRFTNHSILQDILQLQQTSEVLDLLDKVITGQQMEFVVAYALQYRKTDTLIYLLNEYEDSVKIFSNVFRFSYWFYMTSDWIAEGNPMKILLESYQMRYVKKVDAQLIDVYTEFTKFIEKVVVSCLYHSPSLFDGSLPYLLCYALINSKQILNLVTKTSNTEGTLVEFVATFNSEQRSLFIRELSSWALCCGDLQKALSALKVLKSFEIGVSAHRILQPAFFCADLLYEIHANIQEKPLFFETQSTSEAEISLIKTYIEELLVLSENSSIKSLRDVAEFICIPHPDYKDIVLTAMKLLAKHASEIDFCLLKHFSRTIYNGSTIPLLLELLKIHPFRTQNASLLTSLLTQLLNGEPIDEADYQQFTQEEIELLLKILRLTIKVTPQAYIVCTRLLISGVPTSSFIPIISDATSDKSTDMAEFKQRFIKEYRKRGGQIRGEPQAIPLNRLETTGSPKKFVLDTFVTDFTSIDEIPLLVQAKTFLQCPSYIMQKNRLKSIRVMPFTHWNEVFFRELASPHLFEEVHELFFPPFDMELLDRDFKLALEKIEQREDEVKVGPFLLVSRPRTIKSKEM